ncbi:ABC transporter substrate-binding protein [Aestuariimicrobium ganziense]|uniref:ABC transporter substrate-binding protein n=1 Tax=Aestuariimicrobium ganziense TaxID=2773677 RepID=UPI001F2B3441|nr:ABC transporter substrate-binding protein [Aestuariimicrobium ganziense]
MSNASWTPTRRGFFGLAAAATAGMALSACGSATNTPGGGNTTGGGSAGNGAKPIRSGAAGDQFFIGGMQWGAPVSFSPLNASPAFGAAANGMDIMYEQLIMFNQLDGKIEGRLAKELKEVDKTTWELPLQDGTKWSDGSDLTAEDVVFTFELAKEANVGYASIWTYMDSITANDRTVVVKLKETPYNPLLVRDFLCWVGILPKSYYGKLSPADLTKDANMSPLGSGPYMLDKYDATQIVYKRNDNYWGKSVFGEAKPTHVVHPIFKANNDGDLKLESGELDGSQQFTAQIWKMWEKGKPVATFLKDKPYYLPGSMPSLIFNVTKKGLDNVAVRKAIAYAVNYPDIAAKAMSEYSGEMQASQILPQGSEEKFYDQAKVDATGWKYDKAKAIEILENEAKAKKGSDGIYVLEDGTRLGPWKLITPTGWTDWNTSCEIIAKSLQEVGIDVSTNFPQAATMIDAMQNGNFDLAHYSYASVGPASPWTRFRDVLSESAPIGTRAFWNYGRFKDDTVKGLLEQAAAETDEAKLKEIYQQLDELYRKEIPCVSAMYRPSQFYEFNQGTWTNFPTEDNAYCPPTWKGPGFKVLFNIKKVGS